MTAVVKSDGTLETFDGAKLEASLYRVGAGDHTARRIRQTIQDSLAPGSSTEEIYKRAMTMLKQEARPAAARYSLRRALFEFGPTGHPFEDFVAEIFKTEGWEVEWRKLIPGRCVMHEVDVYAKRGGEYLAAELKYHNDPRFKTDVKVALYVKDDVEFQGEIVSAIRVRSKLPGTQAPALEDLSSLTFEETVYRIDHASSLKEIGALMTHGIELNCTPEQLATLKEAKESRINALMQ